MPKTVSAATDWRPIPGSSTDRATWLDFDTAVAAARHYGMGIGYVLAAEDPFVCVDFDVKNHHNAPDKPEQWTSGEHAQSMQMLLDDLDTYTERSQSGQGWHVWVYGKFEGPGLKRKGVEVYQDARFIVCTGNSIHDPTKAIEDRSDDIAQLVAAMRGPDAVCDALMAIAEVPTEETDDALLERVRGYSNAGKFNALWSGAWATWTEAGTNGQPWMPYQSQSEADMALMGLLALYSKSNEQCRRLFLESRLGQRDKVQGRHGLKYLNRMLRKIRGRQVAEDAVRVEQVARNVAIGDGDMASLEGPVMTVAEMCEQLVLVRQGSMVVWRDKPAHRYTSADAANVFAGSFHELMKGGKLVRVPAYPKWKEAGAKRVDAETLTFDPRTDSRFCTDPAGRRAVNLWTRTPHTAPEGWGALVLPFLEHVDYLVPDVREREQFLDWLAHMEQRPGELPHFGYLMIAPTQGIGRNGLASVLVRVWYGTVAASFDLAAMLTRGFNGRLSHKRLAIVDEINEGGGKQWDHSQHLKRMVTEEERLIDEKYGRQWVERNCCRWLLFSNHITAIPLTDTDRRWQVVRNPDRPRSPEYYAALYRRIDNPAFIAAVREWLLRRDLSRFNPGARPTMNEAKQSVIGSSKSDAAQALEHMLATHSADVVDAPTLGRELFGVDYRKNAKYLSNLTTDAGVVQWRGPRSAPGKSAPRMRLPNAPNAVTVWVLRNPERWVTADELLVRAELLRSHREH